MTIKKYLWGLGVACVVASSVLPALAQNMRHGRPALPAVALERAQNGEAAIAALADHLPSVARHYGLDTAELRAKFRRDGDLWVDPQGQLFFAESHTPDPAQTEEVTGSGDGTAAALVPVEQTFFLHSRASAPRKIYLDFDGHTTSGTSWRNVYNGSTTVVTPAFDLDGNPSAFSAAELERIQYIWQRVVEDYAPFDVDVTTQDPGVEGLRKTTTTDNNYGIRVCIGGSSTDWYSTGGVGGVAYVGTFDGSSDMPCFVFENNLGDGYEKYVAEAISHEVGHTLDLYHDGTTSVGYYQGHGSGADAWAPIMGVGYYKSIVQFSRGEYSSANNTEDDLAKMTASYNIPYLADDYGNDPANATALAPGAFQVSGRIGRPTDVDFFRFECAGGTFTVSAAVDARSANLNVELTLLNAAGNVLAVSNPAESLAASLSVGLPAGTYFLKVDGVGALSPLDTGYSDYGSLGAYGLSGSVPYSSGPLAVASASTTYGPAPLTVQFSSNGTYDSDGSVVSYLWTFGNGATSSEANPIYTYSSAGTYTATLQVADNSGLTDADSLTITVLGPPAAPSDVVVAAACNSADPNYAAISLSWRDNSSNESLFRIQWSNDGSSWSTANEFTTTAASYTHGYLPFSGSFFYRVRSENASGVSAWTAIAGATTHNVPIAPALNAPTVVSSSQINLSWNATANATGYRVERSQNQTSWTVVANTAASTLSLADTGVVGSTTYYYRVLAAGPCGYLSAPSPVVSATTPAGPIVTTQLSAPVSLTAKVTASTTINLHWTDTTGSETGFYVERSLNGTTWTRLATLTANSTAYSNPSLASRTRYYYRVQAFNSTGVSGFSNVASATTRK